MFMILHNGLHLLDPLIFMLLKNLLKIKFNILYKTV